AHAAVHRNHFIFSNRQLMSNRSDLLRTEIAFLERSHLALHAAEIEEQLLLRRGGAHLYQRPRTQNVFLDRGADPPHRVSGEAEPLVWIEFLDGLHEADIAFGDHFSNRQTITAIAHRNFRDETQV